MTVVLTRLLDDYVRDELRADPIRATALGVHDFDDTLGDVSPDAIAESRARHKRFLAELEKVDAASLDATERLDWRTGIIEARTAVQRDEHVRVWARAPYWYAESLGSALTTLISRDFAPIEQRAETLRQRLEQVAGYLSSARQNLAAAEVPPLWVETGITSADGLHALVSGGLLAFAEGLPAPLARDLQREIQTAAAAVAEFAHYLRDLGGRAGGNWACGPDYFDFLLSEYHLLDLDHQALDEFGSESVEADRRRLVEFAAQVDPGSSWQEQIARIKDDHPQPDAFIETYELELHRARDHTERARLATLPDGEVCRMGWVPEFLRASLPIAVMSTTAPFEAGLDSEWLITPSDPRAPERARLEQMRDNCYVFAESIAGHEIYPGHHLQKVHHKLGTRDATIRRYFSSPQFVEGWGLYVEDLFQETGFFDNSAVTLFKLRNALWRSVRVVVDVGLHTAGLSFEEAVALLREDASLDTHMAEGEVRRYTRHDNPTYPSSYLLGCTAIHQLRSKWQAHRGQEFSYLEFHDTLMSYGSLPVKLIADQMLPD